MAYPNRSHSINEGENTTVHLQNLITNFFLNQMPPGPK
jgi:dipeptidyl-peptidase-4